jgi:hypothetical protein
MGQVLHGLALLVLFCKQISALSYAMWYKRTNVLGLELLVYAALSY